MCAECVHRVRRRGGKVLSLCPICSHAVEMIAEFKPKKRSLFTRLGETVKMKITRAMRLHDHGD